ncbi:MAG: hypothetical protein M3O70_00850 [Actinomycetota bacterium]|nr:hypothetical protein [Actinomycetota bacterium]
MPEPRYLIFDASPLSHFARAAELDILCEITNGFERATTQSVLDEVRTGARKHPELHDVERLGWLTIVRTDSLPVLQAYGEYSRLLGSSTRDVGEASVLAWCEVNGGVAYVDDQAAHNVGNQRGVEVRRTLNLIIEGCRRALYDEARAQALVQVLADRDARLPLDAVDDLFSWARIEGLWP